MSNEDQDNSVPSDPVTPLESKADDAPSDQKHDGSDQHDPNAPQQSQSGKGGDEQGQSGPTGGSAQLGNKSQQKKTVKKSHVSQSSQSSAGTNTGIDESAAEIQEELEKRRAASNSTHTPSEDELRQAYNAGLAAGQKQASQQTTHEEPAKKKNWFQRHPIATGALVVGLACMYPVGTAIVAAGIVGAGVAAAAYGTWKLGKAAVKGIKSLFSKKGNADLQQDNELPSKQKSREAPDYTRESNHEQDHGMSAAYSPDTQKFVRAAMGSVKIGETHHPIPHVQQASKVPTRF